MQFKIILTKGNQVHVYFPQLNFMCLLRCVPYLRIWSYLPVKYQGSMRNQISLLLTSQMPEPEEGLT